MLFGHSQGISHCCQKFPVVSCHDCDFISCDTDQTDTIWRHRIGLLDHYIDVLMIDLISHHSATICMDWMQLRLLLLLFFRQRVYGSESLWFCPPGSCMREDPTSYPIRVLNRWRNACLASKMSSNCIVWGWVDVQLIDLCVRLQIRRSF